MSDTNTQPRFMEQLKALKDTDAAQLSNLGEDKWIKISDEAIHQLKRWGRLTQAYTAALKVFDNNSNIENAHLVKEKTQSLHAQHEQIIEKISDILLELPDPKNTRSFDQGKDKENRLALKSIIENMQNDVDATFESSTKSIAKIDQFIASSGVTRYGKLACEKHGDDFTPPTSTPEE
ncbi:hypothetical protein [uncultured Shewanella sp.]|uniref:hypothetical protein n=1 Tax=uncultured Shewanella sp. TaxID=173975 RepID=UPI0026106F0D|nr:hypothetical protein [uncultured Shewanella sp.]